MVNGPLGPSGVLTASRALAKLAFSADRIPESIPDALCHSDSEQSRRPRRAFLFIEPPLRPLVGHRPPLVSLGEDGQLDKPAWRHLKGLKIVDAALMLMRLG